MVDYHVELRGMDPCKVCTSVMWVLGAAAPGRARKPWEAPSHLKSLKETLAAMPQPKNSAPNTFMTPNKQQQKKPINNKTKKAITTLAKFIPAAKKAVVHTTKAVPKPTKEGVLYKHREYISQVVGQTTFNTAQRQLINPGNALLFPWLSTVAGSFEKFKIHKLKIQYEHQVGTNVGGFCGGYLEYDPSDAPPANLAQLLNNFETDSGAPYDDFSIKYRRAEEGLKNYFVDPAQGSTGFDPTKHPAELRFYTVAAQDVQLGLMWVDYEIELLVPNVKGTGTLGAAIAGWYTSNNYTLAYDQYYEAWNRMSQPNTVYHFSDVIERGPYTIGSDYANRSRINVLIPGNYDDLFAAGLGNHCCLYFDTPGTYQIDMKYQLYLGSTDPTITNVQFAFDNGKIAGNSTARYLAQEIEIPGYGLGNQVTVSLLLVITDVATRVAWRHIFETAATTNRHIFRMGVIVREVSEELITGVMMKAIDMITTGSDPTLSGIRQHGNVQTEVLILGCPLNQVEHSVPTKTPSPFPATSMGPGDRVFQFRQ